MSSKTTVTAKRAAAAWIIASLDTAYYQHEGYDGIADGDLDEIHRQMNIILRPIFHRLDKIVGNVDSAGNYTGGGVTMCDVSDHYENA